MTKNELKAKLTLAVNMAEQTKALLDEICGKLAPYAEDDIFDMANEIQDCERTDVEEMMRELEANGYLSDAKITEEGERVLVPAISINKNFISDIEVSLPLEDGGRLTAYTNLSDSGTYQTGTMYYDEDDFPIDLSLAEIKRGELAEAHGMSKDNRDIDTYLWTDLHGNLAMQNRFSHEDIVAALESEQETERG